MSVAKLAYTSFGDPASYVAHPGTGTDGVVAVLVTIPGVGTRLCSGTVLPTRRHVITAAHCFTNETGVVYTNVTTNVRFNIPGTAETLTDTGFTTHPTFTQSGGDLDSGGDLAIIRHGAQPSPAAAEARHIHRAGGEVGSVSQRVGYGWGGTGAADQTIAPTARNIALKAIPE